MLQVIQPIDGGPTGVAEVPAPTCGPGQVLIANAFSLVSVGTEKMVVGLARKSLLGKAWQRPDQVRRVLQKVRQEGIAATLQQVRVKLGQPMPLGYSSAGTVLEVGVGVQSFQPGDRVASNGPHAGVAAVGQNLVARVPDGVPFEQACYAVVGSIALQGVRLARVDLGAVVGVIGLGLIGQITVSLLKASGCKVVGTDPDPSRCLLAVDMGADWADPCGFAEAVATRTDGYGADAVLITASTRSNGPLEAAARAARQKARIVAVGAVGMDVPRHEFYPKELELVVSCSYGPGRYDPLYEEAGLDYPYAFVRWTEQRNIQAVLDLMGSGRLDVGRITTHRFPIDRAPEAYTMIQAGSEPALGVVLAYPGEPTVRVARRVGVTRVGAQTVTGAGLGIGFVGAGNFASTVLLPALAGITGLRLRGLCSAGGLSAVAGARRHGFAYACSDAAEILSDPDTTAVFIATRHDRHTEMLLEALRAGKNVFVEKPLALTLEELGAVEAYLAEGPYPLWTVGFNRRFGAPALAVRDHFRGLGEPLTAAYRFNAGDIPKEHWTQDEQVGGGRIIGEACHAVDLLTFLIGSPPTRVCAATVGAGQGLQVTSDRCALTLQHADGSLSTVLYTAGGDRAFSKERVEVFGGGRVGVIDDFRRVDLFQGGKGTVRKWRGQEKGHRQEVAAFVEAVRSGGPMPIPTGELLTTSYATIAAMESIRTGAAFDLPSFKA